MGGSGGHGGKWRAMWQPRRGRAAVLVVVFCAFVSVVVSGSPTSATPPPDTLDGAFSVVAEAIPAFGGAFVDQGSLLIWMTGHPEQASWAQDALAELLQDPSLTTLPVVALPADFAFSELERWHDHMAPAVLAIPGVVLTDIDESTNRLYIGIGAPVASTTQVKDMLRVLDIPLDAVVIEPVQPVRFELRDYVRPLVGGIQIGTTRSICTLGFIAEHLGVYGIVTASHCTDRMGGVEGTIFGQPTVSSPVARETIDPPLFRGDECPSGRRCRYSDAAFARLLPSVQFSRGQIANPPKKSTMWNGVNTYQVQSEGSPLVGQRVQKIGRTTGETYGTVTRTCVNISVSNTDVTMLCQVQATYPSGAGDSGAPVIRADSGSHARGTTLVGMHWGSAGSFSPIRNIQIVSTELGGLKTCAPKFSC
jgi:hypothetical protein